MKRVKAYIGMMREAAGGWGIAWAAWVVLAITVQLGLLIYQTNQPGAYDSSEKTEIRRNVNMVFSLGIIGLMIPVMHHIRRWQEARAHQPGNPAGGTNQEVSDDGTT